MKILFLVHLIVYFLSQLTLRMLNYTRLRSEVHHHFGRQGHALNIDEWYIFQRHMICAPNRLKKNSFHQVKFDLLHARTQLGEGAFVR